MIAPPADRWPSVRDWVVGRRVDVVAALAAVVVGSASATVAHLVPELVFAGLVGIGFVLSALSLMTFLRHGGAAVTVTGMLSFGVAVFGGFAAVYLGFDLYPPARATEPVHTVTAAWMLLGVQAALTIASAEARPRPAPRAVAEPPVRGHAIFAGAMLALSIACVIARESAQSFDLWAAGFGALAFLVLVDLAVTRVSLRPRLVAGGFAVAAGVFYATVVFEGQGRLNLASLAAAALALAALSWNRRIIKVLWAVATPLALIAFSLQRLQYFVDQFGAYRESHEGIGSVIVPLMSTGRIIDALGSGTIQPTWGYELWAALTIWIPRPLWPDKPIGFGKDIIGITQPEAAGNPESSSAAVLPGEFLWDWGLWGWPICAVLLIAAVILIDRSFGTRTRTNQVGIDVRREWLPRVAYAVLAGSSLNYVWSGAYTWLSRALIPLAVIALVMVVSWWLARRRSRPQVGRR